MEVTLLVLLLISKEKVLMQISITKKCEVHGLHIFAVPMAMRERAPFVQYSIKDLL